MSDDLMLDAVQNNQDDGDLFGDDVTKTKFNLTTSSGKNIGGSITGRVVAKFEQRKRSANNTSGKEPPTTGQLMIIAPPTQPKRADDAFNNREPMADSVVLYKPAVGDMEERDMLARINVVELVVADKSRPRAATEAYERVPSLISMPNGTQIQETVDLELGSVVEVALMQGITTSYGGYVDIGHEARVEFAEFKRTEFNGVHKVEGGFKTIALGRGKDVYSAEADNWELAAMANAGTLNQELRQLVTIARHSTDQLKTLKSANFTEETRHVKTCEFRIPKMPKLNALSRRMQRGAKIIMLWTPPCINRTPEMVDKTAQGSSEKTMVPAYRFELKIGGFQYARRTQGPLPADLKITASNKNLYYEMRRFEVELSVWSSALPMCVMDRDQWLRKPFADLFASLPAVFACYAQNNGATGDEPNPDKIATVKMSTCGVQEAFTDKPDPSNCRTVYDYPVGFFNAGIEISYARVLELLAQMQVWQTKSEPERAKRFPYAANMTTLLRRYAPIPGASGNRDMTANPFDEDPRFFNVLECHHDLLDSARFGDDEIVYLAVPDTNACKRVEAGLAPASGRTVNSELFDFCLKTAAVSRAKHAEDPATWPRELSYYADYMGSIMIAMFNQKAWVNLDDDIQSLFARGTRTPLLLLFAVNRKYAEERGLCSLRTHNEDRILGPLFDKLYPLVAFTSASSSSSSSSSSAPVAQKRKADADEDASAQNAPTVTPIAALVDEQTRADAGDDDQQQQTLPRPKRLIVEAPVNTDHDHEIDLSPDAVDAERKAIAEFDASDLPSDDSSSDSN